MAIGLEENTAPDRQERATDEDLVAALKQGKREAHDEMVRRYEREIFNYLRSMMRSAELAEEAFVDTFTIVFTNIGQFEDGRTFRPWLYRIAYTKAIDLIRREKRQRHAPLEAAGPEGDGDLKYLLVDEGSDPANKYDTTEEVDWLRDARLELTPDHYTVLSMVYDEGLKYREAAVEANCPLGTIKSRVHGAFKALRDRYPSKDLAS